MRERGGRTIAMPMQDVDSNAMHRAVFARVEVGTTLHTDEATVYKGLGGLFFTHETVNHSAGEFARDAVTTNGVEASLRFSSAASWVSITTRARSTSAATSTSSPFVLMRGT